MQVSKAWKKINQKNSLKAGYEYVFVFKTGKINEKSIKDLQELLTSSEFSRNISIKDVEFTAPDKLKIQGLCLKNPIPIAVIAVLICATAFAVGLKLTLHELYLVSKEGGNLVLILALICGMYYMIRKM